MQLINAIEFFKGIDIIGAKRIWDMFVEKIGPELLSDFQEKAEPR